MSKQVYRGVEFDSAEMPKNDHHHDAGLRYRGAELDGAEAERDAQAVNKGYEKVYRGSAVDDEAK